MLAVLVLAVLILAGVMFAFLYEKYSPSKERMSWNTYFEVTTGDEAAVILNDQMMDFKAKVIDGEPYVTTDTLYDYLNSRFYWDSQENLLLYTTPTELITASVGSNTYTVAKQSYTEDYTPVKVDGDTAYVALKYIQKYTGIQYELMTDEVNRINIKTKFGTAETVTVKKNGNVRYRAGIKSPILTDVAKGDILYVLGGEGRTWATGPRCALQMASSATSAINTWARRVRRPPSPITPSPSTRTFPRIIPSIWHGIR